MTAGNRITRAIGSSITTRPASRADIEMTKEVARAAATLGITVHDHIIIARGRHARLKGMELI